MLLHIGENYFVDSTKTVMVLNLESIFISENETTLRSNDRVFISENETKSLIVMENNQILESPIDSKTLRKRENVLAFTEKRRRRSSTKMNNLEE
jgi:hypothetical protein